MQRHAARTLSKTNRFWDESSVCGARITVERRLHPKSKVVVDHADKGYFFNQNDWALTPLWRVVGAEALPIPEYFGESVSPDYKTISWAIQFYLRCGHNVRTKPALEQ